MIDGAKGDLDLILISEQVLDTSITTENYNIERSSSNIWLNLINIMLNNEDIQWILLMTPYRNDIYFVKENNWEDPFWKC